MATRKLTALGLSGRFQGLGVRSPDVEITGASSSTEGGVASTNILGANIPGDLAPTLLPSRRRNFNQKGADAVNVEIVGASLQFQTESFDGANTDLYPDTDSISVSVGVILVDEGQNVVVEPSGAQSATGAGTVLGEASAYVVLDAAVITTSAEAVQGHGTVTGLCYPSGASITGAAAYLGIDVDYAVSLSGAGLSAQGNNLSVESTADVEGFPLGAGSAAEAGTLSLNYDWAQSISGVPILAQGNDIEVLRVDSVVDVVGLGAAAEPGTVTPAYDWILSISGAQINAQPSESGIDTSSDVSATVTGAETCGCTTAPEMVEAESIADDEYMSAGWGARNAYDAHRQRKASRAKARKKMRVVDKRIAEIMHEQEEIESLEQIVTQHADTVADVFAYNQRVGAAFQRALMQGNYSALMAFEREMERAIEEEEFLLLAVAVLG